MDEQELLELVKGKVRTMFQELSGRLDDISTKEELKAFIVNINNEDLLLHIKAEIQKEKADRIARISQNQIRITDLDEADSKIDQLLQ